VSYTNASYSLTRYSFDLPDRYTDGTTYFGETAVTMLTDVHKGVEAGASEYLWSFINGEPVTIGGVTASVVVPDLPPGPRRRRAADPYLAAGEVDYSRRRSVTSLPRIYGGGPHRQPVQFLRMISAAEPWWAAAIKAKESQGLRRIFAMSSEGAYVSIPGYDLVNYVWRAERTAMDQVCIGDYNAGHATSSKGSRSLGCGLSFDPSITQVYTKADSFATERMMVEHFANTVNGTYLTEHVVVVLPPKQQVYDQSTIITMATTLSRNRTNGFIQINETLTIKQAPAGVLGVEFDYAKWVEAVTDISKRYTEYHCGLGLNKGASVRCVLFDDSANLVMHPSFTPSWTPVPTFLAAEEPEFAEYLVELEILEAVEGKHIAEGQLNFGYRVKYESLPTNGNFTGLHSGAFNAIRVPNTNLVFALITGFYDRGSSNYCGPLTETCMNVVFPRKDALRYDVCDPDASYYQVEREILDRGHSFEEGVPKTGLSNDQLALCSWSECVTSWSLGTELVVAIILAALICLCVGVYFLCKSVNTYNALDHKTPEELAEEEEALAAGEAFKAAEKEKATKISAIASTGGANIEMAGLRA